MPPPTGTTPRPPTHGHPPTLSEASAVMAPAKLAESLPKTPTGWPLIRAKPVMSDLPYLKQPRIGHNNGFQGPSGTRISMGTKER